MEIAEIKPGDDERLARVLLSLQQAAYAVEASIIGDDRIPPLRETLDELRGTPLRWLGAFDDRRLVGAIARSEDHSEVDIHRLVVDPTLHRRGVGRTLVSEVLALAGRRRTVVCTGRANLPARALYEGLGFVLVDEKEVIPDLWVTRYAVTQQLHRRVDR
ncbi:GNAT family N-acetyltransferase [Micromonospora zamorensis]|uniref:GNAT family N-acetyltransferase n=1 Tax=Micromonospora zamorensis TaxID=709883 RepID=UPI00081F8466|nr:GNAT family N-acetyltransferase [Micromonospora zamorensis]SCG41308.1 Acetyltransferase (GNAT) family protein [Micromonospora zamorensis]